MMSILIPPLFHYTINASGIFLGSLEISVVRQEIPYFTEIPTEPIFKGLRVTNVKRGGFFNASSTFKSDTPDIIATPRYSRLPSEAK